MRDNKKKRKKAIIIGVSIAISVVAIAAIVGILLFVKKSNDKEKEAKLKAEREAKEKIERQEKSTEVLQLYMDFAAAGDYTSMYDMIDSNNKGILTSEVFVQRQTDFYGGIHMSDLTIEEIESNDASDIEGETVVIAEGEKNSTNDDASNEEHNKMILTYSTIITTPAGVIKFNNEAKLILEEKEWKIEWDNSMLYPNMTDTDTVSYSVVEPARGKILDRDGNVLAQTSVSNNDRREYPYGEKVAHFVGFTFRITADELKEREEGVYDESSFVGKKGLEYAFEDQLRGQTGCKVAIINGDGNEKKVLASVEAVDGEDLKTTLDMNIQTALYNQLTSDNACSVAINPYTGELLAMVSTPSYDNNGIYTGKASDTYNRFARTFCPGSIFKSVTAAVGLDCGAFTADEDFGASTTKWQKDSSWGNLYITTQHACQEATLINGLTLSDNVYFAKAALKIGGSKMKAGLDKLGFNESVPLEMNMIASQYSNSDGFSSEGMLANSGYGQGEILVNPVHMASIYSAFLNDGNMIQPCFVHKEPSYWKEGAITATTANTVKDCLINVVNSAEGTGHVVYRDGMTLGGKTGTAEIKKSQNDESGTEIGWFIVFDAGTDKDNAILIVTMVENVKDRGGSAYVVNKTKAMLDSIY